MRWVRFLWVAFLGLALTTGLDLAASAARAAEALPADQALLSAEPPPPDLARIYFYRQPAPLLIALAPDVVVNGRSVGSIGMGDVFFRDAKPGRYQVFLSADTEHVIELTLSPGEISYVRATLRVGLGTTRLSAERINAVVALQEINEMDHPVEQAEPKQTQR